MTVQAILAGEDIAEDAKVSVLSEPCTSRTPVRALITFEDAPVIELKGMSVSLGKPLGNAELQASRTIESKQLTVLGQGGYRRSRLQRPVQWHRRGHLQLIPLTGRPIGLPAFFDSPN